MKLTEEEKQKVLSKWNELISRVTTRPNQDFIDLVEWALAEFSQLENITRWIHCSERLPTKEDANSRGEVWVITTPSYHATIVNLSVLSSNDDVWWATPIEKLKKPTPPDPFEEWLRAKRELTEYTKNLLKEAYELGRKNLKVESDKKN